MVDLGIVPIYPPAANEPGNFRVKSQYKNTSGAASQVLYEDSMMLMPLDEFYHVATPTLNNTSYYLVFSGIDNQVFVASGNKDATIYEACEPMGTPLTLEPNRDNYFFLLCDRADGTNVSTDQYTMAAYVIPRFVAVRGAL